MVSLGVKTEWDGGPDHPNAAEGKKMVMDRMGFTMKLMEGLDANLRELKDHRGTQDTVKTELARLL